MTDDRTASSTQPQNLDAEERVLGAMMLSANAIDSVLGILEPEGERKFYRRSHGTIYGAARSLHLSGKPVDPVTLVAELEQRGAVEDAGGKVRVAELCALTPSASNAGHYAELVRNEWARRGVLRAVEHGRKTIAEGAVAAEALAGLERRLIDVRSQIEQGRTTIVTAFEAARRLEEAVKNPPDPNAGIPGPWHFVPRLRGGRVYVLAGYTAHGKTVAAVQFLKSACEAGARVGYVSLEMSADDLTDRVVASFGIPLRQVQGRKILDPWQARYRTALATIARWAYDVVDDPSADAAAIHRYAKIGRYDLVVVDHLHRFDWSERRDLERQVRAITNTARTLDVPVLLLAQLSRAHGGQHPYPRPSLASLRETAIIEQEAWVVSFVWRKHDEKHLPTEEAEFIVAKNRSGPVAAYDLRFVANEVRYEVAA